MRRKGGPTKLTADSKKRLLDAIRLGTPYKHACAYAGITYATLRNWINDADANPETSPYAAFVAELEEAKAAAIVGNLATIEKAAREGTWQAAAWKLERRYPEEFGRTVQEQRVEVKGKLGVMRYPEVTRLSTEVLRELVAGVPPEEVHDEDE